MARKSKNRRGQRYVYSYQDDPYGKTHVTGTYGSYNKTKFSNYAKLRSVYKRVGLYTSPSYLLTPKPIRRVLAKTNIPSVRTIAYRTIRGTNILTGGVKDPCKRAANARRSRYFRKKNTGGAGKRPRHLRNHKC